jgi:hypothetical protein
MTAVTMIMALFTMTRIISRFVSQELSRFCPKTTAQWRGFYRGTNDENRVLLVQSKHTYSEYRNGFCRNGVSRCPLEGTEVRHAVETVVPPGRLSSDRASRKPIHEDHH